MICFVDCEIPCFCRIDLSPSPRVKRKHAESLSPIDAKNMALDSPTLALDSPTLALSSPTLPAKLPPIVSSLQTEHLPPTGTLGLASFVDN